ncbi:U32 family peptidase [Candidatus Woesearchaeota archaeon]|nr:U32 family peptidase [Candidatus Woesearchaeota archaeon]
MRINCPLSEADEVLPLISAGADTFYTGVDSRVIFESDVGVVSRRTAKTANLHSMQDLNDVLSIVHENGKRLFLAINEHFYSEKQLDQIIVFISKNPAIDGFIVSDISLILRINKEIRNVHLIASTGTHILNEKAIDFYSKLNISEIILPRHLSLSEIRHMVNKHPSISYECFIKESDGDCLNIDGLCNYSHGFFEASGGPCKLLSDFKMYSKDKHDNINELEERFKSRYSTSFLHCGACAIKDLFDMGVSRVKVVGRDMTTDKKIKDVTFVKNAIKFLSLPKKEYLNEVKSLYNKVHKTECAETCFYGLQKP